MTIEWKDEILTSNSAVINKERGLWELMQGVGEFEPTPEQEPERDKKALDI